MTFKTFVKDASSQQPIPLAAVIANDEFSGLSFSRGTDGGGYADVAMFGVPNNRQITMLIIMPGYTNGVYYLNTGDGSDQVINIQLNPSFKFPSKDTIRAFRGSFGGLIIPELQYSINNSKILFTPGYVCETPEVRTIIRQRYKDAGLLHFPINLYNDSPVYHDQYPQWDDHLINQYLMELLNSGLIPVGSMFADNVKTVKPVVNPRLVPAGFTGWENPWPILRPAQDADNLFYVARQYFGPDTLIYWHNPDGQGAPYYNAVDWGYPPGTELNAIVWNYVVHQSGCQGLLFQGKGWKEPNANPPYDGVATSIARLNDFVPRFKHGINGWPICDLNDFEETVYYMTTLNGSHDLGMQWAHEIRNAVLELNGFCNG